MFTKETKKNHYVCIVRNKVFNLAQTQKVLYNNTAYKTFGLIRLQENTFIVNF